MNKQFKRNGLTKEELIDYGISDIKINEESTYGYDIYDRWGKKRKIQMQGAYPGIICFKNNTRTLVLLHRAVYAWFIGPIEKGFVIDHIDEDKLNTNLNNLQKLSYGENIKKSHEYKKGLR